MDRLTACPTSNMKTAVFFISLALIAGCSKKSQPDANSVNAAEPVNPLRSASVIAHTTENQQPGAGMPAPNAAPGGSKWSQGGEAIDTTKFDAAIAKAEKKVKANPADAEVKKAAAQAYFERGFALTEARQYASAIGDYRRALKYDPNDADSKKWIDQILSIYAMLKKQAPKEGEEPPPLAFNK